MRRVSPSGGSRSVGEGHRATVLLAGLGIAAAALALATEPAHAAFRGKPGPIAYSKFVGDELSGGSGGLFAHGPRIGQAPYRLTEGLDDRGPSFSHSGRQIAFSADRDADTLLGNDSHIYLINSDGSGIRKLTDGPFVDSDPSFFPNGRRIVFGRRSDRHTHLFAIRLDGSGLRQLTNGPHNDSDPVVSPNGRRIAFVSDRDRDGRDDRSDIFSMRADGKRLRVLIDGRRRELDPDYAPSGRQIAFASNRDRGGPNIFLARANGRHVKALTHSRGDCFAGGCFTNPCFSPDGRHIAALRTTRYLTEIEVMRRNGSRRKTFVEAGTDPEGFGSVVGAPGWGPRPR